MTSARNYRPSFHENKPKTLVLYDWKRAFWACFHENRVYKFGHSAGRVGRVWEDAVGQHHNLTLFDLNAYLASMLIWPQYLAVSQEGIG
jgi:hypothetical protein